MKSPAALLNGGDNGGGRMRPRHTAWYTAWLWMRQNLFNSWSNTIITFVALWLLYLTLSSLVSWGLTEAAFGLDPEGCKATEGACWSFIADTWKVFMVGRYPYELYGRPLLVVYLILAMALAGIFKVVRQSLWYYGGWVLAGMVSMFIIRGADALNIQYVDTGLWGGLMLTIILSVAGIFFSFPIGVVLALGRRSQSMPIVRALCVGYIELIRGVPLITILFMASNMLPLFFPSGFEMDKVLKAQIGIILFSAAYVAEVVRGGLQAVPRGQIEAAMALGLPYWQTMTFIVLPQALRIVIPPLVSTFIALLKDTSLVAIIGLFDLLGISRPILSNPVWLGQVVEAYVFIGAIYWIICFSISTYSKRLEVRFKSAAQ